MLAAVSLLLLTALVAVTQTAELHLRSARQATSSCRSDTESCILLNSCPKLQRLLRPPTRESIRRLQGLRCGTQNRRALVCCPSDRPVTGPRVTPPPVTPRPTPTTVGSTSSGEALLPRSCGQPLPGDKIHGGTPAELGAYPWMAVLGFQRSRRSTPFWGCGGSLINSRYVLTAAHCTVRSMTNNMDITIVRLGENNLETPEDCRGFGANRICAPAVLDFSPEEVVRHELFNTRGSVSDDVALIRLDRPVEFTPFIQPVCLPGPGEVFSSFVASKSIVVIGFGDTELGRRSLQLLQVTLPVVPMEQCRAVANYNETLMTGPGQVCLGGQFQRDSCFKDSGGPAMVTRHENGPPYVQVGIVSYGTEFCGVEAVPAVYADVTHYRRWIVDNLKP